MTWVEVLRRSVRPSLTYLFAAAFVAGFFLGKIPADAFVPAAVGVFGFWFGSRNVRE